MKLGLTGGIGCGKSTVGTFMEQLGWLRVDSDQLVRTLLDTDAAVHAALLEHFGEKALTAAQPASAPNWQEPSPGGVTASAQPAYTASSAIAPTEGKTSRNPAAQPASAASAAESTPTALRADRSFLAERIFASANDKAWLEGLLHPLVRRQWEAQLAAAGSRPILVEIPLLFEKKLEKHFDLTVCVEADRSVQLSRLQSRGMSLADAEARIASQMPLADKVARADKILSNNGNTDFLRAQTLYLSRELLA